MKELWETLVNWLQNSGFSEVVSIGTLGTIIGGIISVAKSIKKTTLSEINAIASKKQMSDEFKETSNEIQQIKDNQALLNETIEKLSGMLLVVLNNSKISASAKQQAIDLMSATSQVSQKVETITNVVEKITENVKENIKFENDNNVETNPYLSNLDVLVNNNEK